MADISVNLDNIKPLLSSLGLGQAPPAPPKVDQLPTPQMPPPGPPPPTPAVAGFSQWMADPRTQEKVASGITLPGTPLMPPPAPMASVNPPQQQFASMSPPGAAPTAGGPPTPSAPSPAAPAPVQTQDQYFAAHPNQLQHQMGTGGKVWNAIAAGLIGAAGGIKGNPMEGVNYARGVIDNNNGVGARNNANYNAAVIQPLQQTSSLNQAAAQLADTTSQTQQRAALAARATAQANAPAKPEKPENVQQQYSDAVADALSRNADPGKDPKVQQIADAITALQRQPGAKEPTASDRAIAVYAKPPAQRTPEENAFLAGYEKNVKVTKTDPGVARTSVLLQMPTAVADPNNPGGVIYQTRQGAIGMGAPSGIDTKIPEAMLKSATSGDIGKNLNAFNTASAHLNMLSQASDALQNGDVQGLNRIGNEFNKQTGSPAPTNFQAVKSAVAGEVSKTFKGGQATDAEIKEFNDAVSSANSPQQLKGVIATYQGLMNSKREALQQQVQLGMQGKPNFGITPAPTGGNSGGNSVATPDGLVHTFPNAAAAAAFKKAAKL